MPAQYRHDPGTIPFLASLHRQLVSLMRLQGCTRTAIAAILSVVFSHLMSSRPPSQSDIVSVATLIQTFAPWIPPDSTSTSLNGVVNRFVDNSVLCNKYNSRKSLYFTCSAAWSYIRPPMQKNGLLPSPRQSRGIHYLQAKIQHTDRVTPTPCVTAPMLFVTVWKNPLMNDTLDRERVQPL